jgi:alpha-glucosidase
MTGHAPSLGSRVTVFLVAPDAAGITEVHVRYPADGEPEYAAAVVDRVVRGATWWRAEVELRNPVVTYRFLVNGPGGARWLNAQGLFGHDVPDHCDFRLTAWSPPPAWAADAVVYEIFPDRFARSASAQVGAPDWSVPCRWDDPVIGRGPQTPYQFYGGDLDGIVEHLDHIAGLGANTVYLTPIFPAPSNHRYDAASFGVDPLLGGEAALARLAGAVHRRGMRLLGDLTTNHCGQTHPWFAATMGRPDAPEREMFYVDGDDYECWRGVASLPKFNWGSAELRRRFRTVIQEWLSEPYGLDGWRVDVANMTGRRRADSYTHEVARLIRESAQQARPDGLVVAEHAHDASADLDVDGWHGTMNYSGFLRPVWSWLRADALDRPDLLGLPDGVPSRTGGATVAAMRAFAAQTSWRSLVHSWNMLGSHDTPRVRTVVGPERGEVALGLLATYPGIPMVFAGDEIGLEGDNGEDARRTMPWNRAGGWDLRPYQDLLGLRRSRDALRHGGLRWAHVADDSMAYLRESASERLLVVLRRRPGGPLTVPGVDAATVDGVYGPHAASISPDGAVELPEGGPSCQIFALS